MKKGRSLKPHPFNEQKQKQRKANIMEITDFHNRISQNAKNPLSRAAAQHVKSLLSQNCGLKEIEVGKEIFEDIISATGLTPNVGSIYYFIRIDDLGNNTVDIQTRKDNAQ